MDGVVIDSEKLHLRAMGLTLEQNGIEYPEEILNDFVGRSDRSFFTYAKEHFSEQVNVDEYISQKDELYFGLISSLEFVDGFEDFIKIVQAKKLKTALVTSSSHFSVEKADEILNFTRFFDVILSEEDTAKHKPNPEPYLLALEKTNSVETTTLIIEDSINGIKAGKAAGCKVCGITTSFNADILKDAGADYVCESYSEIMQTFLG